jgi:hypothetical protein
MISLLLFCAITITGQQSFAPPPFACEVRYHYREHYPDAKPGEKNVSAPGDEREYLPKSQVIISDHDVCRIVRGSVKSLPYKFTIKILAKNNSDQGTLEANIVDPSSGKSLKGFPIKLANPMQPGVETSRTDFTISITKVQKDKIKMRYLSREGFVTYANLVIGIDDDILRRGHSSH